MLEVHCHTLLSLSLSCTLCSVLKTKEDIDCNLQSMTPNDTLYIPFPLTHPLPLLIPIPIPIPLPVPSNVA